MTQPADDHRQMESKTAAALLIQEQALCEAPLYLNLGELTVTIKSNSRQLLNRLADYFSHLPQQPADDTLEIVAIESDLLETGIQFTDWKREAGKTGRKDAYLELSDGRLILKVRTGMLFLQSRDHCVAAGPCLTYDNQLVNFINSQIMNWLQNRHWLICHAAALMLADNAVAVAGFSGGGKSTLMLHLMEHPESRFLTNDRLFLRGSDEVVEAVGIPKLPRINPGTVVNNPRLQALIDEPRRSELLAMPKQVLWELEEKFDVDVEQFYGKGRIDTSTAVPLAGLIILNWHRDSDQPVSISQVSISRREELLKAVMKSPGPFYQDRSGRFLQDESPLATEPYLALLDRIPVYEVCGGLDFTALTELCFAKWGGRP
ncbi:HprK-related kinase B [Candidatus Thiodiazotropha endoloripes]|nr:HprK-related kinase B [Candidatus Thiodiazotropha endoloripes]